MTTYIVQRHYGKYGTDFLTSWDILWGPVWTGDKRQAITFQSTDAATDAASTAEAIMLPRVGCVPDFGSSRCVGIAL